jgi:hypothetical protein
LDRLLNRTITLVTGNNGTYFSMYEKKNTDGSFTLENCQNDILSIQVALDGFSFCIYDYDNKRVNIIKQFDYNTVTAFQLKNELLSYIRSETLLSKKYERVFVSYKDGHQILIPNQLVDKDSFYEVFSFSIEKKNDDLVLDYELENRQQTVLFSMPKVIRDFFLEHFNNVFFIPYGISSIIRLLCSDRKKVVVHFDGHLLQINIGNNTNISNHLEFYIKNEDDAIFYILKTFQQLEITQQTSVEVAGKVDPAALFITNLSKFYPNLKFQKYATSTRAIFVNYNEHPDHFHINLVEQMLCG